MDSKIIIGIIVLVGVVAIVGGYYGYETYKNNAYNDLLLETDGANGTSAQSYDLAVNVTDKIDTVSYETSIKNIKNAINLNEKCINQSDEMINIAPDNATKEYAKLRKNQYINRGKIYELLLKLLEDIKANGILAASATLGTFNTESENIGKQMEKDQIALIKLVNDNPDLKKRLNEVLGEKRTKEILEPVENTG